MCVLPTFKVKTGIKAKAAVPPNKGALIEKYLHSEEWLYSRGVPTLCRGSRFVPDGQPVKLEHPPWPPVFDCCLANDLDLVSRYLEAGADVNMRNPRTGRCLLHEAAVNGMTDMVRLLIDTHKADVNVITAMGEETPLHLAVKAGHRFLVFYLITRGADVTAVNRFGMNPMHYVDRRSIAVQLINNGTPLTQKSKRGLYAWQYVEALYPWQKELVEHLKELTAIEELSHFKAQASQVTLSIMYSKKVASVFMEQLQAERERKALQVIAKATRQYLRWRNGEKWQ